MSETRLLKPNEGQKTKITGFDAIYRTDKNVTGDLLDYFELVVPAGQGAPLHIHHKNDESLHVVEGEFTFQVDETEYKAPAGTFLYIPRGVPHKFTNTGASEGRLIGTFTPSGTFEFFNKLTGLSQDDFEEIQAYSKKYGHEVLEVGTY
ncbi:cupin domain-containing protein [Flavivirga algicola]|uniref:Cupin domain-containing protein n=1 Tax=Flavivirga algicola TaxID=2729136 RepID=A0ABX1S4I6_9FLAO|nr:cupin domain-containing protein [Flavivirga algicola]NMH89572.1 cupin domain-containing protein [Flavivirga algicola]